MGSVADRLDHGIRYHCGEAPPIRSQDIAAPARSRGCSRVGAGLLRWGSLDPPVVYSRSTVNDDRGSGSHPLSNADRDAVADCNRGSGDSAPGHIDLQSDASADEHADPNSVAIAHGVPQSNPDGIAHTNAAAHRASTESNAVARSYAASHRSSTIAHA